MIIELEMTEEQAWFAAQFLKRVGWSEMRENAASEEEAYQIRDALNALEKGLHLAGFHPR